MDSLIPVGEIDTKGVFQTDSLFWHEENANRYAQLLLKRGAYIVAVGGRIVGWSHLAKQLAIRSQQLSS